jgi:hypothetical protein
MSAARFSPAVASTLTQHPALGAEGEMMKIEIDLNDILGDEYGSETLKESIQRQVIDNTSKLISDGIRKRIDEETTRILNDELKKVLIEWMPTLVEDVMNGEYTPVSRYGERHQPTTFRNELVKAIGGEMVYKKTTYDSDKNAFTKAVDAVISENVKQYQVEFNKLVKDSFTKDALAYAVTELKKRLGV